MRGSRSGPKNAQQPSNGAPKPERPSSRPRSRSSPTVVDRNHPNLRQAIDTLIINDQAKAR